MEKEPAMPALVPLFVLLAFPILEIATFVYVGQWLGVWTTVALVVLAAILGVAILRYQGLDALRKINQDIKLHRPPARGIANGFMIVVASFLLIIPGFLSDIVGLLLLVPPVRQLIWRLVGRRINVSYHTRYRRRRRQDDFVDLSKEDYRRNDNSPSSGPRLREPD